MCYVLLVVCCIVCCGVFVVRGVLLVCCMMCVDRCALFVGCCLLCAYLPLVVWCESFDVRCLMFVVRRCVLCAFRVCHVVYQL